jgi:hypothetical protein
METNGDGLRNVARYQRNINLCILATLALVPLSMAGGSRGADIVALLVGLAYFGIQITALAFVFLLARALYGTVLAVLLGLLMFAPCISLLVLLLISQRATSVLRKAGVKVGLLGANPNQVPSDGRSLEEVVATFR